MFHGFANVWTPVEISRRLRRKPVALTVAGERVVLFRGPGGAPAALIDRCPHRGVALSLGRVTDAGTLACPFHGWEFAADGACARVPLNPRARCELLGATPLPVREAGGLVWLYTAPGTTAPHEPVIHESLTQPGFTVFGHGILDWNTHWTRAMENMLDMPHLPFVHKTTIGMDLSLRLRPDSEMVVTWEPTEHGGIIRAALDGQPDGGYLEHLRPNTMALSIPVPGARRMVLHVFCVPAGENQTRMILVNARDFGRYNPLFWVFKPFNRIVAGQDKPVVETSDPVEVPPPAHERSVASDRATLQFRKYYLEVLRESSAAPAERLVTLGKAA